MDEWETLNEALQGLLEARFREYTEHLDREVFGWSDVPQEEAPPVWQLPADWRRHLDGALAQGEALSGEVQQRDEGGAWRTVNLAGFPVNDRRKVKCPCTFSEAGLKIPYVGS